jgi:hypothetical protein
MEIDSLFLLINQLKKKKYTKKLVSKCINYFDNEKEYVSVIMDKYLKPMIKNLIFEDTDIKSYKIYLYCIVALLIVMFLLNIFQFYFYLSNTMAMMDIIKKSSL